MLTVYFAYLGGTELLIVLLIVTLLFGAQRIPQLMKSMGEGVRGFKDAIEDKPQKPLNPPSQQQTTDAQPAQSNQAAQPANQPEKKAETPSA